MASDLRPNLEINQLFVTSNIPEIAASNPEVIFGVCRQQVWREKTGSFVGGQVNPSFNFPDLSSGAAVEQPTAVDDVLKPHVFIQNKYGIAEVNPSYNWTLIPPTFDLSPALSATFEISAGTTGAYSAATGKFTDANSDFIEDEVAPGDIVLVNGIAAFDVVLTVSDVELDVTKRAKVGPFYSGGLSIADLNGDRTFTDALMDFTTLGVIAGDLVEVAGWAELYRACGLAYTAGPARTMTSPLAAWATAGVAVFVPSAPATPASGSQVWLNNGVDWIPTFAVTVLGTETSLTVANLMAAWPALPAVGTDVPHEIWNYDGMDLGAGAYQGVVGSYVPGTFTQADGFNFVALLPAVPPYTDYFIVIHDADGNRPTFRITAVLGAGAVSIVPIDSTYPALNPGPLTWELWQSTTVVTPLAYDFTAALSADLGSGVHTITLDARYTFYGVDFASIAPIPAVGDIIYSAAGVPLFTVILPLPTPTVATVQDIVFGTLPAGAANFGFRLADASNVAALRVTSVAPTTMVVRNVLADPPPTSAYPALLYSVYVADLLSSLNYTIEKTLTGVLLTGDVLVTYMARRNDYANVPVEITKENRESLVGPANPANPLGLAAQIALLNSSFSVFGLMVPNDTNTDWTDALSKLESAAYYILCPLTQDEAVLTAARAHVSIQSTPAKKRDRLMWQCHLFERIEERIARPAGTATYTKTPTVTTITFLGLDLSAYGVIIGDDFIGTTPACQGRIITMVTGTNSVITIVNDNGIVTPPPAGVINGWLIQSKDLTDEQFADKINAYPAAVVNRRIRNIYPDTCEVVFTDSSDATGQSGFYGGGDVTMAVPAHYVAAMEASKRATVKPAQSLTQYPGSGIHRLLNPFGDPYGGNETLNDRILDGGNYLMSQPIVDGNCAAVRAISTDTSTLFKMEDSVAVQVDNFARLLRTSIRPLLGPYNIDDLFLDMVSANVNAVRNQILDAKDAKEIKFLSIREDPDHLDTILLDFEFTPYVAAAKAVITIYI